MEEVAHISNLTHSVIKELSKEKKEIEWGLDTPNKCLDPINNKSYDSLIGFKHRLVELENKVDIIDKAVADIRRQVLRRSNKMIFK